MNGEWEGRYELFHKIYIFLEKIICCFFYFYINSFKSRSKLFKTDTEWIIQQNLSISSTEKGQSINHAKNCFVWKLSTMARGGSQISQKGIHMVYGWSRSVNLYTGWYLKTMAFPDLTGNLASLVTGKDQSWEDKNKKIEKNWKLHVDQCFEKKKYFSPRICSQNVRK